MALAVDKACEQLGGLFECDHKSRSFFYRCNAEEVLSVGRWESAIAINHYGVNGGIGALELLERNSKPREIARLPSKSNQ